MVRDKRSSRSLERSAGKKKKRTSALRYQRIQLDVHVEPARLADPERAVQELLAASVLRYNEPLGGVVLAYDELRLEAQSAAIVTDYSNNQLVALAVSVRCLLFVPTVGQRLDGVLLRRGTDHLALLVYGTVHATIPDPPNDLDLGDGGTVRFTVRCVHVTDGLLSMLGQLDGDGQAAPPG